MKTCTGCGNTKAVSEFSKDRTKADGLRTRCKSCKRTDDLAYQSQRRDEYAERTRRWREENKDRHDAYMRAYMRDYYRNGPLKARA